MGEHALGIIGRPNGDGLLRNRLSTGYWQSVGPTVTLYVAVT